MTCQVTQLLPSMPQGNIVHAYSQMLDRMQNSQVATTAEWINHLLADLTPMALRYRWPFMNQ